ncbi:peptidase domain-containing ABC transporter [Bacillus sp. BH2]|uniref:peptidase domain-containing ABC transporter n=1 Tax=Bacillus sp. BH2 TaxID=2528958 RepID=UPI001064D5B5|nr:peptidase domain-containing ABC transporter [Bacillus sp. BH2]TEA45661.1 peptidase domain-containing ABC transporter [Bacillus sp. BH2]
MGRIKLIEQMEHSECGLACVAMLINFYKENTSLSQLRENYGVPNGGYNLLQMVELLKDKGIFYKGVKIHDVSLLKSLNNPAILFWENHHFVVLCQIKKDKALIADPAVGKKWISLEELNKKLTKYALINDGTYLSKKKISIKEKKGSQFLLGLISQNKVSIVSLLLVSFLIQIISIGIPLFIQSVIDNYSKNETSIIGIPIIAIFLICSFYIVSVIRTLVVTKVQINMDKSLMEQVFKHLLNLPYKFFQNRTTGELLFRLNSNTYIRQILSEKMISIIIDTLLIFVYIFLMFKYSTPLTTMVLFIGGFLVVISIAISRKINTFNEKQIALISEVQSSLAQTVEGMFTIKAVGCDKTIYNDWHEKYIAQLEFDRKKSQWTAIFSNIPKTVQISLPLLTYLLGTSYLQSGDLSIGQLIAFNTMAVYFLIPLLSLSESYSDILTLKIYITKLLDILMTTKEKKGTEEITSTDSMLIDSLYFSYSRFSPPVLKNINLRINEGEKIAIVGRSGSGKSSLLKILMGLMKPTQGKVTLGGINLQDIAKSEYQKLIGVVTQSPQLFNKTLADNIRLGRDISKHELETAVLESDVNSIIYNLPQGLEMMVSEFGNNLSGGQKQKVTLARAIVNKPKWLFMDEPTSSLDNLAEKKLMDFILANNMTSIVVAHRFSQIEKFDRIIVLEDGMIVGAGEHEELLRQNEQYRSLYMSKIVS